MPQRPPTRTRFDPLARPDGSCLGRRMPEDEDDAVPPAPAGPEEPPADAGEPLNPA